MKRDELGRSSNLPLSSPNRSLVTRLLRGSLFLYMHNGYVIAKQARVFGARTDGLFVFRSAYDGCRGARETRFISSTRDSIIRRV